MELFLPKYLKAKSLDANTNTNQIMIIGGKKAYKEEPIKK